MSAPITTRLDAIKVACGDDALFQQALLDFVEAAVRLTAVGRSLPAATTALDKLRQELEASQ